MHIFAEYMYIYMYIDTSIFLRERERPPTLRKMVVAIGMLKNVGYLDRISNRMPLIPCSTYLFSYCFFSIPFFFALPPFRLQFYPYVADAENEFSYQTAIW